jgi:hypothetical protein
MKPIKFILTIICALALTAATFASTYVGSNLSAGSTEVITTPSVVTSITLFSTNATPTIVRLYDGSVTYVTEAYTNRTYYTTNIASSYVTTGGTTNLQTNTVLTSALVATGAATNNRAPILTIVVPASSVPITFDSRSISFANSTYLSNNLTGLSATIEYRTP